MIMKVTYESRKNRKFYKKIRKDNNLTQKELADKLGVTYQAVSKWENGLNIPDIGIIKEISKIYNIEIDELLSGEKKKKRKNIFIIVSIILLILLSISIVFILKNRHSDDISSNTISTSCSDFKINGFAAYTSQTATLQITEINYCGAEDTKVYDNITCTLYEEKDGKKVLVNTCDDSSNTTLENYLDKTSIKVDNYTSTCKVFTDANLYLEITAVLNNDTKEYIIPIDLDDNCK